MSSVKEWWLCRGFILPLHKAVLRRWVVWCRTSFSQGPGASRRSTGYQRAKADSLGRNTLATLASGVPADFGQPLGDLGRRRTRSAAHEPRSSEARPSVGTTPRRYSVSALTCFMSPALQATNAFTADDYRKSSDAFCTISPLEQTASVVACAVRQASTESPSLQTAEDRMGPGRQALLRQWPAHEQHLPAQPPGNDPCRIQVRLHHSAWTVQHCTHARPAGGFPSQGRLPAIHPAPCLA